MKTKQFIAFLVLGLTSFISGYSQTSMKFKKSKQISVVSFIEMGSTLEFSSDYVKLNGVKLEMTGPIRFTTKFMFYPVKVETQSGYMDAEIGWGTRNDHECMINWGDNTFEQFEMTEIKSTPSNKKPITKRKK